MKVTPKAANSREERESEPVVIKFYDAHEIPRKTFYPVVLVPADSLPADEERGRQTVILFNNIRIAKSSRSGYNLANVFWSAADNFVLSLHFSFFFFTLFELLLNYIDSNIP